MHFYYARQKLACFSLLSGFANLQLVAQALVKSLVIEKNLMQFYVTRIQIVFYVYFLREESITTCLLSKMHGYWIHILV